jgi:4a-hydroxytetrahydrobiopterin dehydratase
MIDNERLSDAALREVDGELPGWSVEDGRLRRRFEFQGFPEAMAFMVRAAFDAERLGHHPNWSNVYNAVEVEIWSHDLGGVSRLCLELARCMNAHAPAGE